MQVLDQAWLEHGPERDRPAGEQPFPVTSPPDQHEPAAFLERTQGRGRVTSELSDRPGEQLPLRHEDPADRPLLFGALELVAHVAHATLGSGEVPASEGLSGAIELDIDRWGRAECRELVASRQCRLELLGEDADEVDEHLSGERFERGPVLREVGFRVPFLEVREIEA